MIVPLALAALLSRCAPRIGPVTMSAIVLHESGGKPFAIHDNTTARSYDPARRDDAVELARELLDLGHNVDVGYAQINSHNFSGFGINVATAFDPCTNIAIGGRILRADYFAAAKTYGPGQGALTHALSAYNSGNDWSGLGYARAVDAVAAQVERGVTARERTSR